MSASLNSPVAKKEGLFGYGMCNPVIKKMAKVTEENFAAGISASYSGIISKTIYFLICCLAGFAFFFPIHDILMSAANASGSALMLDSIADYEGIIAFNTCPTECLILFVTTVIVLFAPLIAWLIRPTIPVTGTLYALCEGYFMGLITEALVPEYRWISLAAFVLTAVLVGVMLFIFKKEYIKVNNKLRVIISSLFITMLLGSLLLFILSLVPTLKPIISSITTFMGTPVVSIILSAVYIVIAALFLMVDFDVIKRCVEENMPKKFEWMAAFGLTYTVIYIYFKILNLILQIMSAGKKNGSK